MTKGWRLESARHALARKGIETGRKLKAKWAKFKEKRQFKKTPIGKLTNLIEKLDKFGYTDEEIDDYIKTLKYWADKGEFRGAKEMLQAKKEFLVGWREAGEREKEFKKMEQDKKRLDAMRASFAKRMRREPTESEIDEMIIKL